MNKLTPRETETMTLTLVGKSNQEIAQLLGITERTVKIYQRRILKKTGTRNFLELACLL